MSDVTLSEVANPSSPAAGKKTFFVGTNHRPQYIDENGNVVSLVDTVSLNYLLNGGFRWAQRQVPGTLTTYSSTADRAYTADQWGITNENASIQYQRADSIAANETSLVARYYGKFSKITSTGKMVITQPVLGEDCGPLRGQRVRFQAKLKASSAKTIRMIVMYLTASGTVDTLPATFVSAFGANTVDPTFGTNLTVLAPVTGSNDNATISGNGLSCSVTTAWQRFSGCFDIPLTAQNVVVAFVTDSQFAAADVLSITEAGLYLGVIINDWDRNQESKELPALLRHYCSTFPIDTAPAQNAGATTGALRGIIGKAAATALAVNGLQWRFPVPMWKTPGTITTYQPNGASAQVARISGTTPAAQTATATANSTNQAVDVTATGDANGAVGDQVGVHLSAEAKL